jgi:hypothetical protein
VVRAWHVGAALAYLGLTLWVMRPVLPAMAETYPVLERIGPSAISDGDQSHMVWAASRTARTLVTNPTRLWRYEICYPFPTAVALGHHGYASALMAAVPYALTGEPVLAHNVVSVLMLWLSAVGMYALAWHWTGSAPAAFVAGLLFAFQPFRLFSIRWPAIVGNEWTPLALLFTDRVFARGRWRDAAALAGFLALQILESFYQMVPLAILGLAYGGRLALAHRDRLVALLPKLGVVAAVAAAVTAIVVTPYLQVRAVWGLTSHQNTFPLLNFFLPGHDRYPGTVLFALAAVGLADRVLRPAARVAPLRRPAVDPRGPLALGGLVLFCLIVGGASVPGGFVRSPLQWLVPYLPGIETVRGLQYGIVGVWLVASVLAAYGVRALSDGRARPTAVVLGIVIAVLAVAEVFHPGLATASFGGSIAQVAAPLSVPPPLVRLFDELPPGAVLDLPARLPGIAFQQRGHRVLLAAFHRHPTTGCFASFASPLADDVDLLGARLPDPRAAEALRALGFGSVLVHEEELAGSRATDLEAGLQALAAGDPRVNELGTAASHRLYALAGTTPARSELTLLSSGVVALAPPPQVAEPGVRPLTIRFRNVGPATFRHPDPIAPTAAVARWYDAGGTMAAEARVRVVLPLALAAGDALDRRVDLDVPPAPGPYRVAVSPADRPDLVVAVARVTVRGTPATTTR